MIMGETYQDKGNTTRDSQKIPCGQNPGGYVLFLLSFNVKIEFWKMGTCTVWVAFEKG